MSEINAPRSREEVRMDSILRAMQSNLNKRSGDSAHKLFSLLGLSPKGKHASTSGGLGNLFGTSTSSTSRAVRNSPALQVIKQLLRDQEAVHKKDKERIDMLQEFLELQRDTFDRVYGRPARTEMTKTRMEQNKALTDFERKSQKIRSVWDKVGFDFGAGMKDLSSAFIELIGGVNELKNPLTIAANAARTIARNRTPVSLEYGLRGRDFGQYRSGIAARGAAFGAKTGWAVPIDRYTQSMTNYLMNEAVPHNMEQALELAEQATKLEFTQPRYYHMLSAHLMEAYRAAGNRVVEGLDENMIGIINQFHARGFTQDMSGVLSEVLSETTLRSGRIFADMRLSAEERTRRQREMSGDSLAISQMLAQQGLDASIYNAFLQGYDSYDSSTAMQAFLSKEGMGGREGLRRAMMEGNVSELFARFLDYLPELVQDHAAGSMEANAIWDALGLDASMASSVRKGYQELRSQGLEGYSDLIVQLTAVTKDSTAIAEGFKSQMVILEESVPALDKAMNEFASKLTELTLGPLADFAESLGPVAGGLGSLMLKMAEWGLIKKYIQQGFGGGLPKTGGTPPGQGKGVGGDTPSSATIPPVRLPNLKTGVGNLNIKGMNALQGAGGAVALPMFVESVGKATGWEETDLWRDLFGWGGSSETLNREYEELLKKAYNEIPKKYPAIWQALAAEPGEQKRFLHFMSEMYKPGGNIFGIGESNAFNAWKKMRTKEGKNIPGHKTGLLSAPYDGYTARLHRGEMVISGEQADFLRSNMNLIRPTGTDYSSKMDPRFVKFVPASDPMYSYVPVDDYYSTLAEGDMVLTKEQADKLRANPAFLKRASATSRSSAAIRSQTPGSGRSAGIARHARGVGSVGGAFGGGFSGGAGQSFASFMSSLSSALVTAFSGGIGTSIGQAVGGAIGGSGTIGTPIGGLTASMDNLGAIAMELISKNEGSYSSVNRNDVGATSIGKFQWRGPRAYELLRMIYAAAPQLFTGSLKTKVAAGKQWGNYLMTVSEAEATRAVLKSDVSKQIQDQLMIRDFNSYISHGKGLGITDPRALILYADLENNFGQSGVKNLLKGRTGYDEIYQWVSQRQPKKVSRMNRIRAGIAQYFPMAEGGVVPGGEPTLLMVGEGKRDEAVIPLNTPAADRYLSKPDDEVVSLMPVVRAIEDSTVQLVRKLEEIIRKMPQNSPTVNRLPEDFRSFNVR